MALTYPTMIEGQWNKVAEGISSGSIYRLSSEYTYYETHVLNNDPAPAPEIKTLSAKLFETSNWESINSSYSLDLYIYPERTNGNGEEINNSIRVDS